MSDSTQKSPSAAQLGQLLLTSGAGYAASAARSLLEARPELERRTGPDGFQLWKLHFQERISELAPALSLEEPQLFAAGAGWSRAAIEARDASLESFAAALGSLREALLERLPAGSEPVLQPYFEAAQDALGGATPQTPSGATPLGEPVLQFLQFTLDGHSRDATNHLLEMYRAGATAVDLFETIVVPAQREIGELWHRGEINIAEEHLATLTTQKAIAVLAHHTEVGASNGQTVVISSVTGDAHDLGLRLLAELFTVEGWRSVALGADVPRIDLLQALEAFEADLLVLSATLAPQLLSVRRTIDTVRQRSRTPDVKILVGGRAFRLAEDLWCKVGADGSASTLRQATSEAKRLLT